MSAKWPMVKLGEVLRRSEETVLLQPDAGYRELTVKLWGKGVIPRRVVRGAEVAASRRFLAKAGHFVLSRIDARNGAMGLVPKGLDGAIVTNDFPVFTLDETKLVPGFLGWMSRTADFVEKCQHASEGTTNRIRLQEERFLAIEIPVPPLSEQRRIASRIEELATQIEQARGLRQQQEAEAQRALIAAFWQIAKNASRYSMQKVAPLVRRAVEVDPNASYPELGIRSFGKGTFHKPALTGFELGSKRLYRIEPGDLLFMNVFAWEGAVAVARPEDEGRYGSHRFITCLPEKDVVTPHFLCFYFLTEEGLEKLREASPGGAGRNRTLGLTALSNIQVPVPKIDEQQWFDDLQTEVDRLKMLQAETASELDALLPAILDRAFKGEL
ncbi:restriction endonuclease subunit S [Candidatus Methylomirabilis sp.]|uniref:restriction endonuclease subunit S n=1 Tax=Candidatus Methylomirabilis sp. TaxID=2032687 RepID=UPI0030764431